MRGREQAPPDAAARLEATTRFDVNIVVQAGAGTGKTSLLVERILIALGLGLVDIDRLAAITFTKKAAGEMRQRVATGLERLLDLAQSPGEVRLNREDEADRAFEYLIGGGGISCGDIAERTLAALGRLDRATIETIHTFCATLLRSFPMEARVDPGFEVDQGEHYHSLLEEQWERFLQQELGEEAPRAGLWEDLLSSMPLGKIAAAAREMAGFDIPPNLLAPPFAEVDAGKLFGSEIARIRRTLGNILERQEGMTPKSRRIFGDLSHALGILGEQGLHCFRAHVAAHDDLADRVAKQNAPSANKKLLNVSKQEFESIGKETLKLCSELLEADDEMIAKVVETVAPFAEESREALLHRGFVGFDGLLALARNLLRDYPDVRDSVKNRYGMLLLDEFQDTDPLQYEIVLLLGEIEGGRAAEPYEAELAHGRLFIVGDAKQSIYRFRGADYAAFARAVKRITGSGGLSLELTTNFRSLPELLSPINALFDDEAEGGWTASGYQPEYIPISSLKKSGDAPAIELWDTTAGEKFNAEARRKLEGRVIAEEIERLSPEYSRVTILLRVFSDLHFYLRPLRQRGIPYIVDGGRGFMERPEVGQLIAILRALRRPADQVALLSFLRSPVCGPSDAELAAYAAADGRWDWRSGEPGPESPNIAAAFELLRELQRETVNAPPDEIVRRALAKTELLCLSGAAFEGPQRVANLRKLAATAGGMARDGRMSLNEVLDNLEREYAPEIESDSPLADEKTNAVRVLTIHKAKGLENDIVIVPDLARGRRRGDKETTGIVTLEDGTEALALRVNGVPNVARILLDLQEERHHAAENLRLLYVAMTRAREKLILIGGRPNGKESWSEALAVWGYRTDAPPEDGTKLGGGQIIYRHMRPSELAVRKESKPPAGAESAVRAYEAAVEAVRQAASPSFASPSGLHEADKEQLSSVSGKADRELGMAVGSLVHGLMERWDGSSTERAERMLDEMHRPIAEKTGVDTRKLKLIAGKILDAFLASDLAERYRGIEVVEKELPMLLRSDDGRLYRGSIDLLYRNAAGELVVADFKTDAEEDDLKLRERYGGQLGIYAKAVQQACGLASPPRTELWMLRSGRCISL
jgi:ATP-dependent helicase/nuclease subunit A